MENSDINLDQKIAEVAGFTVYADKYDPYYLWVDETRSPAPDESAKRVRAVSFLVATVDNLLIGVEDYGYMMDDALVEQMQAFVERYDDHYAEAFNPAEMHIGGNTWHDVVNTAIEEHGFSKAALSIEAWVEAVLSYRVVLAMRDKLPRLVMGNEVSSVQLMVDIALEHPVALQQYLHG